MNKKNQSLDNFEWPEFLSEIDRLKSNTKKYKDLSVTEAFEDFYKIAINASSLANDVPDVPIIGSRIKTRIVGVDKNQTVLDPKNLKYTIKSSVNLYKYEMFKKHLPNFDIDGLITNINKDEITVDPITPMLNDWLDPILKDPGCQRVMYDQEKNIVPMPVIVKDLQLTNGGFIGQAVVPNVSEFVGEDYTVEAFIPGSQIVLNITDDFEKFNGATVPAFIVNSTNRRGKQSLICSVKEYIKFIGDINMISIFNSWCEESELWQSIAENTYDGIITGIINSSKKCGVFVEIPSLSITGMVQVKPDELVDYKPHTDVRIKIAGFEEDVYYNHLAGQVQHNLPYVIEDGLLKKCNIKTILKFV